MMEYITAINQLGATLVATLGPMSFEWALWAACVQLLIWGLRIESPALRHGLWLLVLAKPFFTLLVQSPLPWHALWPQGSLAEGLVHATASGPAHLAATGSPAGALAQLNAHGVVALVWLIVASGMALRLLAGQWAVWKLRRRAERVIAGGVRGAVDIALTDDVREPLLTGWLRPLVLLPRAVARRFSAAQLELVVAHEAAHARRRDNWVLLVQRWLEVALFFHPVAWLCGRNLRREAERACDDAVLRRYRDPLRYADILTKVVELCAPARRRVLAHGFAGRESQFAERVRRVLAGEAGGLRPRPRARTLLLLAGFAGLPNFSGSGADTLGEQAKAIPREGLRQVSFTFDFAAAEWDVSEWDPGAELTIDVTSVQVAGPQWEVGSRWLVAGKYSLGAGAYRISVIQDYNGRSSHTRIGDHKLRPGEGTFELYCRLDELDLDYFPNGRILSDDLILHVYDEHSNDNMRVRIAIDGPRIDSRL